MLAKCHQAIIDVWNDGDLLDLDDVAKLDLPVTRVKRSESGREDDVQHFILFAKLWSGGNDNPFIIIEVEAFSKTLPDIQELQRIMIGKLGKLELGVAQGCRWRGACLKVALNPVGKPLTPSDVTTMGAPKTKPHVLQANSHMEQARKVVNEVVQKQGDMLSTTKLAKAADLLDQRLVKHVLGRSRDFKSMTEICFSFFNDIVEAGAAVACPQVWKSSIARQSPSNNTPGVAMMDLGTGAPSLKNIEDSLKLQGFQKDGHCTHSATGKMYKVPRYHLPFFSYMTCSLYGRPSSFGACPADFFSCMTRP